MYGWIISETMNLCVRKYYFIIYFLFYESWCLSSRKQFTITVCTNYLRMQNILPYRYIHTLSNHHYWWALFHQVSASQTMWWFFCWNVVNKWSSSLTLWHTIRYFICLPSFYLGYLYIATIISVVWMYMRCLYMYIVYIGTANNLL